MFQLFTYIQNLPPHLSVFLLSMIPISELRGAIPLGILVMKLPAWQVFTLALIGNLLPVIPLLFFVEPVNKYLQRFTLWQKFFGWLLKRTGKKAKLVEKYETLGLMLFVSIPLPGTGAWTGTLAAFLFGIKQKNSLIAITAGVLIAGIIVTSLTLLGTLGGIIVGLFLIGLAVKGLYNKL